MQVNSINANTGLRLKAPRFLSVPFQFSGSGGKITIPTGPQSIGNSIQPQYVFIDNSANQGILILQAGGLNYIISPMTTAGFPVVMGDTSEIKLLSNIGAVGTVILTDTAIFPFDNNPNVNGVTITAALPSGNNNIGNVGITGNPTFTPFVQAMNQSNRTISEASTSQDLFDLSLTPTLTYLAIQNLGATGLHLGFNGTAATPTSFRIAPNDTFVFNGTIPLGQITAYSTTAGAVVNILWSTIP